MHCLAENTLVDMIEGRLDEPRASAIAGHLDGCVSCRELVSRAVGSSQRAGAPQALLSRGAPLGRYTIVDLVGAGAMGVVYAAWDPVLSRKVAIKLLRGEAQDAGGRAQLVREAQALAQLSHPHVIAVHDVGEVAGQVFISMELVDGQTLRAHLRERAHSRAEVLALFCAAGEGLAAAHAKGIVHRDFKPDNTLVGGDGRVRVTDFGLARAGEDATEVSASSARPLGLVPTAPAGTPAYMAPEQLDGRAAGPRADQFSFCVALFEALHGVRPFAATDLKSLRASIERGELYRTRKRAPARIERALRKGLSADPSARHGSMDALLRELKRPPLFNAANALAVLLALLLVASWAWQRYARTTCSGAEEAWGSVWSESQREQARAALEKADPTSGSFAFAAADAGLRTMHAAWVAMRTDACLATRARGEQSEQLLDLRMQCLDDRRREADALVQLLVEASPAVAAHAREAVNSLTSLSRCADTRSLSARAPAPLEPAARAKLVEAKTLSARAKAELDAGEFAAALAIAESARVAAEASRDKTALAQALYLRGQAQRLVGSVDLDDAERSLHAAAIAAEEGHDDGIAADAFTQLCFVRGFLRFDPAGGDLWCRYARAALVRLGGDELREAQLERRLASIYINDISRSGEVLGHLNRAIELFTRAHASESVSSVEMSVATVQLNVGHVDEAIRLYRRSLEQEIRLDGPDKPGNSYVLNNLGQALVLGGRADEAVPLFRHAIELDHRSGSSSSAFGEYKLAAALRALGKPQEALPLDESAVDAYQRRQGESQWLLEPLIGKGQDLLALGRPRDALEPLEHALRICCGPGKVLDENSGHARLALARALTLLGGQQTRAQELTAQAVATFRPLVNQYGSYYRGYLEAALAFQSEVENTKR